MLIFCLALLVPGTSKGQCLESNVLDRFQKGMISTLNSKIDSAKTFSEKLNFSNIKSTFEENVKIDLYRTMSSFFREKDIDCDSIVSWSIIEVLIWHSIQRKSYMIIETKDNNFFVVSYDILLKRGVYLEKMKHDYLSEIARWVLIDDDDTLDNNYILFANFTKKFNHTPEVRINLEGRTLSLIFLIENMLMDK